MDRLNDRIIIVKLHAPPAADREMELKTVDSPFTCYKLTPDGKEMRAVGYDWGRAARHGHRPLPRQQQKQRGTAVRRNPNPAPADTGPLRVSFPSLEERPRFVCYDQAFCVAGDDSGDEFKAGEPPVQNATRKAVMASTGASSTEAD